MMKACVRIQLDEGAGLLSRALRPEVEGEMSRSSMTVEEQDGDLVIRLEAEDLVALRAALNSYLRWTKLAIDSKDAIEG